MFGSVCSIKFAGKNEFIAQLSESIHMAFDSTCCL